MKTKTFLLLIVVSSVCFFMALKAAFADQKRQPPAQKDVVGSWVGYEAGGTYFYRLTLRGDNQGLCSVLFNKEEVDNHLITEWQLDAGKLSIRASPASAVSETITFEVTYLDRLCMECVVRGVTNKWERKISLYNESEFLKRIAKCVEKEGKLR